ncbi:sigma 54-interacting transcriptional regulator [bacterium]|nr:sigma 54-interacting transcriptional regulator [bacterium]
MSSSTVTDIAQLLSNAAEPFFVLNERGRIVFSNRAANELVGLKPEDAIGRERIESTLFVPPVDLPTGQMRVARRPWGQGKHRAWLSITFTPITGSTGQPIATLGHISRSADPSPVARAFDSAALEQLEQLREAHRARWGIEAVPARSAGMQRVMDQLILAAGTELPVTFLGETGTGKKTLAKILHVASKRRTRNLLFLDCRALPPDAQRSELIDITHVTTEAEHRDDEPGAAILEESAGGTLVVVGVTRLAPDLQELLVRLISNDTSPLWRVVATDREPLSNALIDGRLNENLYYLLTRIVVDVPPLRERGDELGELVTQTMEQLRQQSTEPSVAIGVDPTALEAIRKYEWPGNLTELETVLRAASKRANRPLISSRDLPRRVLKAEPSESLAGKETRILPLDDLLESVERRMIELALRRHKGNKSKAAEELGISRPRLHRRAEQLGFSLGPLEENPNEAPKSGI